MKCEYCNNEHDGNYGSGRFCSIGCAKSFSSMINREETNKKVSAKLKGRKPACDTPDSHKKSGLTRRKIWIEKALKKEWETLTKDEKKARVYIEQGRVCKICGISNWQGKPLTFEYHHDDGDKSNDSRKNVSIICPNCHSQTENYRYKNCKNAKGNGFRFRNTKHGLSRYKEI